MSTAKRFDGSGSPNMDGKKVTIRISDELFKQFRIALITRGETAQAVLEQAVKNYLEEGNEMKNKTYAVLANENWENGHILTTVENFPPYNGYLIVDGITEDELENDDDVTEYVEVEVIDPGKGQETDYYPPEDKHGYAIRF